MKHRASLSLRIRSACQLQLFFAMLKCILEMSKCWWYSQQGKMGRGTHRGNSSMPGTTAGMCFGRTRSPKRHGSCENLAQQPTQVAPCQSAGCQILLVPWAPWCSQNWWLRGRCRNSLRLPELGWAPRSVCQLWASSCQNVIPEMSLTWNQVLLLSASCWCVRRASKTWWAAELVGLGEC